MIKIMHDSNNNNSVRIMVDVVDICVPDWLRVDGLLILCIVYKTSLIVLILLSIFYVWFFVAQFGSSLLSLVLLFIILYIYIVLLFLFKTL